MSDAKRPERTPILEMRIQYNTINRESRYVWMERADAYMDRVETERDLYKKALRETEDNLTVLLTAIAETTNAE